MNKKTKRITLIILSILILVGLTIYNITYVNPYDFTVRKETIKSSKIDDNTNGLIIAYFSDIHYGTFINEKHLETIEEKINKFDPDIIIFGGDLFDSALNGNDQSKLSDFLRSLEAKYGKYAILGDKDNEYIEQVKSILTDTDFRILDNQNEKIYVNGSYINLVGLNTNADVTSAYDGVNPSNFTFAISHYPDNLDKVDFTKTDYMLAGHSLNGQVYIPLFNLFYRPKGAENYYHNKYTVNDTRLDITSGIGMIENSIRMFADAEIVIYKLTKI